MASNSDLVRLRDALNVVLERQPLFEVWLDVTVKNEANLRDHFAVKARRAASHRTVAHFAVTPALRQLDGVWYALGDLVVLLTRTYSGRGRAMDSDGIARSLKAVRDGVADALGVDDGDPRVTWLTTQERGEKTGVKVSIFEVPR